MTNICTVDSFGDVGTDGLFVGTTSNGEFTGVAVNVTSDHVLALNVVTAFERMGKLDALRVAMEMWCPESV